MVSCTFLARRSVESLLASLLAACLLDLLLDLLPEADGLLTPLFSFRGFFFEVPKPDAFTGRARVDAGACVGACLALEELRAGDLDEGGFIRFAILSP